MRRRGAAYAHARRRASFYTKQIEDVSRDEIAERDKHLCHICGEWVSVHDATLDHLVPLARGGSHTRDNIKLAHMTCNSQKGARLVEGWSVLVQSCEQCDKMFAPRATGKDQNPSRFCSRACFNSYRRAPTLA